MIEATDIALRLTIAAALGCAVGLERERLDWVAGLRTHMLVCVGAALFMIVSQFGFADALVDRVNLDPSRVAAQVASGVGFLGAGTILLRGNAIRGLTTAASLWAIAAVGLACGGGMHVAACFTTVLVLVILAIVKPLERRLFPRKKDYVLTIEFAPGDVAADAIEQALASLSVEVGRLTVRSADGGGHHVVAGVRKPKGVPIARVVDALRALERVSSVGYERA